MQSFQLIRGGQDNRLQCTGLRRALLLLVGVKLLPVEVVAALDAAYEFLRRLENRLQMPADQQVHTLPATPLARARLAGPQTLVLRGPGGALRYEGLEASDAHGRTFAYIPSVLRTVTLRLLKPPPCGVVIGAFKNTLVRRSDSHDCGSLPESRPRL